MREVAEEVCATVVQHRYIASQHVWDSENPDGRTSYYQSRWWARVRLETWDPHHEIVDRIVVSPQEFLPTLFWREKSIAARLLELAVEIDRAAPDQLLVRPWELIASRPGSAGYLNVTTDTYRLPDGASVDWDIFGGARSVAVVALTEDDQVVLARQYRPGPGRVLDELPGGGVKDGEDLADAAARELLEETGYSGQVEVAGTSWLASASRTQRFVAVVRHARRVTEPHTDPGEFCDVLLVSLDEFRRHLRSGQLTDVDLGYLALDYLGVLST